MNFRLEFLSAYYQIRTLDLQLSDSGDQIRTLKVKTESRNYKIGTENNIAHVT